MKNFGKVLLAIVGTAAVPGIVFLLWFWPWSRLERSPEGTFRRLVSPNIPSSVANISVDGFDSQYSSDVTVTFEMSADQRVQILGNRRYDKIPCESGSGSCYRSIERGGSRTFEIHFADDSNRVWFNYWDS